MTCLHHRCPWSGAEPRSLLSKQVWRWLRRGNGAAAALPSALFVVGASSPGEAHGSRKQLRL